MSQTKMDLFDSKAEEKNILTVIVHTSLTFRFSGQN